MGLSRELLDLVIVGAGPAGIALGAETVTSGIDPSRVLVLEKGEAHSFSIRTLDSNRAPTDGHPCTAVCAGVLSGPDPASGEEVSYLDRAIRNHRLTVHYRETVQAVRPSDGHFLVQTDAASYWTRQCAIAVGAVGKPQRPEWPIPAALKERVTYDVAFQVSGREDVLVVGGGDLAAEFAHYLAQEGDRVVLSYRGIAFRRMNEINRASIEELERNGRLCILRGSNVSAVEAEAGKAWVLFSDQSAPPLLVDRIVLALGVAPPENTLRTLGIDFDGQPAARDGSGISVPGFFLVGDLATGRAGASPVAAFRSATEAMRAILGQVAPRVRLAAS
jgi:thioredoxin reductase (NADPH)